MAYTPTNWVTGQTPLSAANLNNIEQGISDLNSKIVAQNFDVPAASISAGTVGTFATYKAVDVSKTGHTPIAVTLYNVAHPANYHASASLMTGNTVNVYLYRTSASSVSVPAGDIKLRVLYMKDN